MRVCLDSAALISMAQCEPILPKCTDISVYKLCSSPAARSMKSANPSRMIPTVLQL